MITIYLKQYNKIIRNADTGLFEELGYDDILWIDMLQPTIKEQKAVENFMEINLQTKQQVEEIESTSKYSETENAIISNANFFVPTGESFVIEPVSFIISNEGVLVSVRQAESRTFQETEKRLQINYRNYPTGYHIFITLLEVRIDYDADMVELIARQVIEKREGPNCPQEVLDEYADPHTEKYEQMVQDICEMQNFTTLRYHRLDDLLESIGIDPCNVCTYCFNGKE